ncbi:hypothetical protein QOT17_001936 [Balamuthia mandrillaris]
MIERIQVTYCRTPEGYFVGKIRCAKGYTSDEGSSQAELHSNLRGGLAALGYVSDGYELVWNYDPASFEDVDLLFDEQEADTSANPIHTPTEHNDRIDHSNNLVTIS